MTDLDLHVPSAADARSADGALRALDHGTERAVVRAVGAPESAAVELPPEARAMDDPAVSTSQLGMPRARS